MRDYSDGIKEQTEERLNAALDDRPNLIVMIAVGLPNLLHHKQDAQISPNVNSPAAA